MTSVTIKLGKRLTINMNGNLYTTTGDGSVTVSIPTFMVATLRRDGVIV